MNLTSTRRADEFNRLLESDNGTDDPVAGPLLAVAEALSALPMAEGPRPEFRTALRQRLIAVATVQGVGATAQTSRTQSSVSRARAATGSWRFQRRLTALAAGAAVVTSVSGVALGASRSLPGDPLYGMKRAAEAAQLATTGGTEDRGKRHLEFARTRLAEVQQLADDGNAKVIVDTLHDMDVQTRDGANDLFAAYRDSGSVEPLRALDTFTHEQYTKLQSLLPQLPASAQPSARSSLALLAVIATDTVRSATGSAPQQPSAPVSPAPSSSGKPHPAPSASAGAPAPTPAASSTPTGSTGNRNSGNPLPTSLSTPVPTPTLPTIPPLTTTQTVLPTALPSLPDDLTGLLGH